MRFEEYEYSRPNYEDIKSQMEGLFTKIENSSSAGEAIKHAAEIDKIRDLYTSMRALCSIRFSLDTNDSFYSPEHDYFDRYWPYYSRLNARFYQALQSSRFSPDLTDFYGVQFMGKAKAKSRVIDEEILPLLQEESSLVSENSRLTSGAEVEFRGKKLTLSLLSGYLSHEDREVRKEASKAYYGYFEEVSDKTDDYYDKLVKVRHKMAKKLGFESYTQMAYMNMGRTDYHSSMVESFREQVKKYIVPVTQRLMERRKKRTGMSEMQYYDEQIRFLSGNPAPKGEIEDIIRSAGQMYDKISPDTGEFFRFMRQHGLIDVLSRPGKDGGAFSSFISAYKAPFLYANFNGTLSDVNVLTHEAGHAFQKYMSRNITPQERAQATAEASEVHSMSMEFFALPYIDGFFGEDADKYRFVQVEKALELIPYASTVDEFQHLVYANPDATPKERRQMWRETERKYIPYRRYDDCPFLEGGGWWHRQGHIFSSPFYYIDYALAQVCALELFMQMEQDYSGAWKNYSGMCSLGGTRSFLSLLDTAHIASPFASGTVRSVAEYGESYLNGFNDGKM